MSEFAIQIYFLMVEDAIPIALTFGFCNLIVGWLLNAILNRGKRYESL